MSFDIKFIRLDQKHVGLAGQALPFLRCFWLHLINLILKDTNMVFSTYMVSIHTIHSFEKYNIQDLSGYKTEFSIL